MNLRSFSGGPGRILAELAIDPTRFNGIGDVGQPRLQWQAQMHVPARQTPMLDYVFRNATGQLAFPTNHQKIADALPIQLRRVMRGHQNHAFDDYLDFEFPLDVRRIELLERQRNGGAMRLKLSVQLYVEEHGVVDGHEPSKRPPLFGLRDLHRLDLVEDIEIPQSVWIERVLPGIGYGKVHVLEFPAAPLDACAALDHSFKALQQAQEAHKQGRYDDAVGKCRVALDPFFEGEDRTGDDGKTRTVPVLKKSWETRVGESTLRWMNEAFGAMRAAANKPHHSPNSHFGPEESQLIFAVTSAMVAYAARCGGTEGKA